MLTFENKIPCKMNAQSLAQLLTQNAEILSILMDGIPPEGIHWTLPDKWSPLIIVCHLIDEEVEDFRQRLKLTLEDPKLNWPPIDPVAWVEERKYAEQNYLAKVKTWKSERQASIDWLRGVTVWLGNQAYEHPHFGSFSVDRIASNWIAHDYLHIKQLTRWKYDYLMYKEKIDISYAGKWT